MSSRGLETSTAGDPGGPQMQEATLWAVLASARDVQAFCQSWLAIQCRIIAGVAAGVVLLQRTEDGSYAPAAIWPDVRRDLSYLTDTAQRALSERKGLMQPPAAGGASWQLAYPIEDSGALHGVVALELGSRSEAELQAALRQLHWGVAGLILLFSRQAVAREAAAKNRLQTVLELTATAAGEERYLASAMALATELATRFACDRVSIGFLQAGEIRVDAISHSAHFKAHTNLMRGIAAAMEEGVDQGISITCPAIPGAPPVVARAHQALASEHGAKAVCTVPLRSKHAVIGAITLERPAAQPFDLESLELVEALAGLAGPMLDVQRRADQGFGKRISLWWRDKLRDLLGPRHTGLKLGVIALVAAILLLTFAKGEFRVSASTTLEPLVQQAAAAPFNGYVREAPLRAGDLVKRGVVLAQLDDRELKLERLKWLGQQDELSKQFRQAMADRNAAQVQIVSAQLEQARAQVARADDQLARTQIIAPFDGVIVTGDLSQQLGTPVERGAVLFEVAPLASFRLVIKVDERDIAYVKVGQRGALLLSALPRETIGFEVSSITPVSTPREGRNFFRVEAKLDATDSRMRPGMEGVGKIAIEHRRYLWIWSRQVVDGLRLMLWQWLP